MPVSYMPERFFGGLTGLRSGFSGLAEGLGSRFSLEGQRRLKEYLGDLPKFIDERLRGYAKNTPQSVKDRYGQIIFGTDPTSGDVIWAPESAMRQPGYVTPPGLVNPFVQVAQPQVSQPQAASPTSIFAQTQLGKGTPAKLTYEEGGKVTKPRLAVQDLLDLINIDRSAGETPAVLHEGEFVINADAAKAIGPQKLDQLNQFANAPRMEQGGPAEENILQALMRILRDFTQFDMPKEPMTELEARRMRQPEPTPGAGPASIPTENLITPPMPTPSPSAVPAAYPEGYQDVNLGGDQKAAILETLIKGDSPEGRAQIEAAPPASQAALPEHVVREMQTANGLAEGKDYNIVRWDQVPTGWEIDFNLPAFEGDRVLIRPTRTATPEQAPPTPPPLKPVQQGTVQGPSEAVEVTGGMPEMPLAPPEGPAPEVQRQGFSAQMDAPPPALGGGGVQAPATYWRPGGSIPIDWEYIAQAPTEEAQQYLYNLARTQAISPGQDAQSRDMAIFGSLMQQFAGAEGIDLTKAQTGQATAAGELSAARLETEGATREHEIELAESTAKLREAQAQGELAANEAAAMSDPIRLEVLQLSLDNLKDIQGVFSELHELDVAGLKLDNQLTIARIAELGATEVLAGLDPDTVIKAAQLGVSARDDAIDRAEELVKLSADMVEINFGNKEANSAATRTHLKAILYLQFLNETIPLDTENASIAIPQDGVSARMGGRGLSDDEIDEVRNQAMRRLEGLKAVGDISTYTGVVPEVGAPAGDEALTQLAASIEETKAAYEAR